MLLAMLRRISSEFAQAKTLLGFAAIQVLGQALAMAVPLVIAGLFSKDMWGRYSLCEPVIFFFSAILILSAKTPFIIFANQERVQTQSIRKSFSIQGIFLVTSILLFVFTLVAFGGPISKFANIGTVELFYIALAFFAIIMKDFAGNIFMAVGQRITNAFVEFSFGLLTLGFILIFYLLGWVDLRSVFLAYFLASLLVLAGSMFALDRRMLWPLSFDRAQFIEMRNYTLWMMAGTVSSYIISWVGVWLLKRYATIEDSGTYNLAFKFFKGFSVLIYVLAAYFLPYISENIFKPEKIRAYLFHKRPRILIFGILCFVFAWMIIPTVLGLMYHGKYSDAGHVVRILIFGNFAFFYAGMYGPILGALKIYRFPQVLSISQVILNIVLSLLLIPRFGVTGAALSAVLSFVYQAIAFELFYQFKIKKIFL